MQPINTSGSQNRAIAAHAAVLRYHASQKVRDQALSLIARIKDLVSEFFHYFSQLFKFSQNTDPILPNPSGVQVNPLVASALQPSRVAPHHHNLRWSLPTHFTNEVLELQRFSNDDLGIPNLVNREQTIAFIASQRCQPLELEYYEIEAQSSLALAVHQLSLPQIAAQLLLMNSFNEGLFTLRPDACLLTFIEIKAADIALNPLTSSISWLPYITGCFLQTVATATCLWSVAKGYTEGQNGSVSQRLYRYIDTCWLCKLPATDDQIREYARFFNGNKPNSIHAHLWDKLCERRDLTQGDISKLDRVAREQDPIRQEGLKLTRTINKVRCKNVAIALNAGFSAVWITALITDSAYIKFSALAAVSVSRYFFSSQAQKVLTTIESHSRRLVHLSNETFNLGKVTLLNSSVRVLKFPFGIVAPSCVNIVAGCGLGLGMQFLDDLHGVHTVSQKFFAGIASGTIFIGAQALSSSLGVSDPVSQFVATAVTYATHKKTKEIAYEHFTEAKLRRMVDVNWVEKGVTAAINGLVFVVAKNTLDNLGYNLGSEIIVERSTVFAAMATGIVQKPIEVTSKCLTNHLRNIISKISFSALSSRIPRFT